MTANFGLAIGDFAVAPLLYKKALEKGIGTKLPLYNTSQIGMVNGMIRIELKSRPGP